MFAAMEFAERGEHQFSTSLAGRVDGSWSNFNGEFLGLGFFLYHSRDLARPGYDQLRLLLIKAFGSPGEEWGPTDMPAVYWEPSGLILSMYCHTRIATCVQIGLEHAERTAASNRHSDG